MTMETVNLEFTSRFKKTPLYTKNGKTFFGLWNPPDIKIDGDEKVITVTKEKEGQLDLYAYNEYRDASLWWCIAWVNKIMNPATDIKVGKELIVPKLENIRTALMDE